MAFFHTLTPSPPSPPPSLSLSHSHSLSLAHTSAPREGVDPSKSLNTTLLFADKSSCSDAAEKVKTMPAIKVHQLTISHEQQSHKLLLYLDHEGLRNLWKVLFSSENSNSSLHSGLLGVVLDSGVTVWCKPGNTNRLDGSSGGSAGTMEVSSGTYIYVCVCVCVHAGCMNVATLYFKWFR